MLVKSKTYKYQNKKKYFFPPNIDNNNFIKNYCAANQHIRIISEGQCDIEDVITGIHYILNTLNALHTLLTPNVWTVVNIFYTAYFTPCFNWQRAVYFCMGGETPEKHFTSARRSSVTMSGSILSTKTSSVRTLSLSVHFHRKWRSTQIKLCWLACLYLWCKRKGKRSVRQRGSTCQKHLFSSRMRPVLCSNAFLHYLKQLDVSHKGTFLTKSAFCYFQQSHFLA